MGSRPIDLNLLVTINTPKTDIAYKIDWLKSIHRKKKDFG